MEVEPEEEDRGVLQGLREQGAVVKFSVLHEGRAWN